MKRTRLFVWLTVSLAVAGSMSTLLLPARTGGEFSPAGFHSTLLLAVADTILQLGAAALFVWGLKGFKQELRSAYVAICSGIAVLGFANLQLPFLAYFDLTQSFIVSSGLVTVPYIAPALLVFVGVRKLAKLFGVQTRWMSFWFVLGVAMVSAGSLTALGALLKRSEGSEFLATIGFSAWTAIFLFATFIILLAIKKVAGPIYGEAIKWFAAARGVDTTTGASYTLILIALGSNTFISEYGVVLIPSTIAAILFLRSGYYFKLINEDRNVDTEPRAVSLIDVVTFAASQASNPSRIDKALDKLRLLTAHLPPNSRELTPEQNETLKGVYATIELYLVESEPLRQFTLEGLRRTNAQHFGMEYAAFVALITPAQRDTSTAPAASTSLPAPTATA